MRSRTDRRVPQRSDQRRETLLDELETSLQERSFDDINLGEVAERAGVSRSAFYFYFENKAAAVAALMERMVDDTFFVTDVFTMADQTPESRVHIMLDGLFDTWERHRHMFAAMLEARGRSLPVREFWDEARLSFVDAVAQMIRSERAAGSAPDGIDPVVLATMLLEVNDRLLERLTFGGPLDRSQLAEGAAAIWLGSVYGITVQHGRQL
ncbi:TetR/AcrR family transcriptional regulator [Mycolicibacterium confluentis]|uniref:TetR family transcriptional regulator n=1 Tax=Mycolicibacterium confluentis TaxID=28047 RepID=A0A7I7XQZ8_9MYCO|nr:TetR/AcrR family transcriptional regulator [Mycolicibacterium confluentis]MCV7321014.1 TetR/AcrR family transcriptional regulator [Mycolicibacterium confluentis]ORV25906.1 TetR family transcriptional regulator [Mycolicibacterium confluentis]BBZ31620.1 TetR family transcriptional regulator [Mycolicibacterium confluentis]